MRKTLLFATALCLAVINMAQASTPTSLPAGNGISTRATESGTVDNPFTLVEGENTVPAAAGKYFYLLSPSKTGYLKLSSNAALTGGQVRIYGNYIHAKNDNPTLAKGSSEVGSFTTKMEVPYATASTTYFILVDKQQATDSEEKFNAEIEAYAPGQTEGTAIQLATSEFPKSVTLPEAEGTYYYSIDVPANTNKFLVVKSAADLSSSSSVSLYPKDGWQKTTMENGVIKYALTETSEKTYILQVVSKESTPISLTVSYEDIQTGALITLPKAATTGENTFDLDADTEYFSYTATQDGKLTVTVKDGASVTFPMGTGKWDGAYTATQEGNAYSIEAEKGTAYLIAVKGLSQNDTFTLSENVLQPGESKSNPIKITDDTYTLGDNTSNLWLQYTATKDGVIEITCDADYTEGNGILLSMDGQEDREVLETDGTTATYKTKVYVMKGDVLYLQVMMAEANGKKITFTQRDYQEGESYTLPFVLEKGKSINITSASQQAPVWIKVSLPAGETKLRYTGYMFASIYTSVQSIKNQEPTYLSSEDVTLPDGSYATDYNVSKEVAGDLYFEVKYAEGGIVTFSWVDDSTSGINRVETTDDSQVGIYTVGGIKVSQTSDQGVYIIKSNGKTKKVVVKK